MGKLKTCPHNGTEAACGVYWVDRASFDQGERTMFQGGLVAICVGDTKRADLRAVDRIEAVAGQGLVGDRYFQQAGTFSKPGAPDREVTLIESEALAALAQEEGITLQLTQARRNLVTRDVPLNHLVGREFTVGNVVLRGLRLCEPCDHLEKLTVAGVKKGLCHRGGLRAQIVRGGPLLVGDPIQPCLAADDPVCKEER
jgi:MOSC domain-containing protein YiiM